jgi:putative acetyltransferase
MKYPTAIDPKKVGKYPGFAKSGGGYFYDEVLEYRVWRSCKFRAFATYEEALNYSRSGIGAEPPLVLVRQIEWIDEPEEGVFFHKKGNRITEWQCEWLLTNKRESDSIEKFLAKKACL